MSNLHEIIPGAAHWPHFVRNASEQFEARFVMRRSAAPRRRCSSPAWKAAAFRWRWRTAKATPNSAMPRSSQRRSRSSRCASSIIAARRPKRYPFNPQRLAAGHHRPHHRRRPLHDPDAASGARVPHACRCRGIRASGARRRRGCGCSATRASSARLPRRTKREPRCTALTVYSINGVTPVVDPTAFVHPVRRADRRRHRRRRLLHRTLRVPARRFRPHRGPRGRQPAGHLRRCTAFPAPTRSSRRTATSATARCCTAASCERNALVGMNAVDQRQRRHRRIGDRRARWRSSRRGSIVPPRMLVAGMPARIVRELTSRSSRGRSKGRKATRSLRDAVLRRCARRRRYRRRGDRAHRVADLLPLSSLKSQPRTIAWLRDPIAGAMPLR